MSAAMMAILACSATMATLTLLALLVSPLLERRYASGALYALWLAVLLGFLIPVRPVLPKTPVLRVELPQTMSRPLRRTSVVSAINLGVQTGASTGDQDAAPQLLQRAVGFYEQAGRMLDALTQMTPAQAITALYMMGAALTLLVQLIRHARFMRTVRRWQRSASDGAICAAYARACATIGVRQPPALMTCAAVSSPMLVGIFHPRILLPESAPQGDALDMVLRHELTHHRRHDLLLRVLMLFARAMHWFNPAVYLCERAAVHYGELACDECAVRGTDRNQRAAYSGAILAALRGGVGARSLLTTGFSADKELLKRRLIAMMDMRVRKRGAFAAVMALGLSVLLGASLVLADDSGDATKGMLYTQKHVLATHVLEGEATGGATVTVHDVYYDGYLLLLNKAISANAEGEAVYQDMLLGDGPAFPEEYEEKGLLPVGVYCESAVRIGDGEWLYPVAGAGMKTERGEELTDVFLLAPEDTKDELAVHISVGLMETPGELLGGEDAMELMEFIVPITEPATTREVRLFTQSEQLRGIDTLFVAETDRIAGLYLFYTGEDCPVSFIEEEAPMPEVHPEEGYDDFLDYYATYAEMPAVFSESEYDEARGERYEYCSVYKDGPLEKVRVRGGDRIYTIDINSGEITDD